MDLCGVVMITSAENRHSTSDIPIPDHQAVGLPAPSVIRAAKLATIDSREAMAIGAAPELVIRDLIAAVLRQIAAPAH